VFGRKREEEEEESEKCTVVALTGAGPYLDVLQEDKPLADQASFATWTSASELLM